MGMFDYVRCEYPLPDAAPVEGWQTKDTPQQSLDTYMITEDGRLVNENEDDLSDWHGEIEFYTSNSTAVGPQGYVTSDGKPYRGWTFVARFADGRLTRLTGGLNVPIGIYEKPNMTLREWWNASRAPTAR